MLHVLVTQHVVASRFVVPPASGECGKFHCPPLEVMKLK